MRPYENEYSLKKKSSNKKRLNSKNQAFFHNKLLNQIFDTFNISLLVLIFVLSFLSFNSQRQWSNTYKILTKTRVKNNNLIDYISQTEEFYIKEIESLKTLKKTKPKDLIYMNEIVEKKDNVFNKVTINIINGLEDSKYQIAY